MLKKMNRPEENPIDKVLDLINTQQKAIKTADEIIKLKNEMIKICEQETSVWKKEAKYWKTATFIIVATWFISLILNSIIK